MAKQSKHRALLQLVRKIVDVPLGYSLDDLITLRSMASRQYPGIVPIIDCYVELAERADPGVDLFPTNDERGRGKVTRQMHLFDLLRNRKLFPLNSDLAQFAARILPGMTVRRFDKMSNADIAARIIEYLETLDRDTRERLEASMRQAARPSSRKTADGESFVTRWERIIKRLEL